MNKVFLIATLSAAALLISSASYAVEETTVPVKSEAVEEIKKVDETVVTEKACDKDNAKCGCKHKKHNCKDCKSKDCKCKHKDK